MSLTTPIIGHESAQAFLMRLVHQQKLPHALLFSGPSGIGKAALAHCLAKMLLTDGDKREMQPANLFGDSDDASTPEELGYDDAHEAIARIESGGHGNIKNIVPLRDEKRRMSFTTISVDQVREDVMDFMHHTSSEKGWRIVIIDPADGLNRNAENALLKLLEEPPNQTLLILITNQPDRLLPTTRSRCREIKLYPPTPKQVAAILQAQSLNITQDEQHWLTQMAPQSAGQWAHYLQADAPALYRQWLSILAKPDTATILSISAKMAKLETQSWQLAGDLLLNALYRVCLSQTQAIDLLPDESEFFPIIKRHGDSQHWMDVWGDVVHWWPQTIDGNFDKKQVIQSLLFKASAHAKTAA